MIEYAPMENRDVAQIAALEQQCFSEPWSETSVAGELTNPLSYWLVARDGGYLAGYVGSQTVLGESDMMNLAVSPDYRRRGIGENLVESLIRDLKKQGSHCLTLEVRESNLAARALYEKLGFVQIGLRPGYYHKPKENACILRKVWSE